MKKILLASVAAAAVVGFTAMATAQNSEGQSKGTAGGQEEQKAAPGGAGGAMAHPQNGAQSAPKTLNPSGQSAQGAKPDDRVGQSQDQNQAKKPQRGVQDEQRGTDQKGAQEEQRNTQQKGAKEENTKSGVNANEHANQGQGTHGASVQLTQDQRTRIGASIGKSSAARVTSNVNFNVAVGVAVPRSVHVEVLPEDVVEIVPDYEGFDYVVVGDNILIIDPDSLEIVAIIPV
jgi:hypothetical protein